MRKKRVARGRPLKGEFFCGGVGGEEGLAVGEFFFDGVHFGGFGFAADDGPGEGDEADGDDEPADPCWGGVVEELVEHGEVEAADFVTEDAVEGHDEGDDEKGDHVHDFDERD